MSGTIISWLQWWFGLFGVTDPTYTWLGITLVASALLIAALYVMTFIVIAVLAGLAELINK